MDISPITEKIINDKEVCVAAGKKILSHYDCEYSVEGIGMAIDKWKVSKDVVEQEMIDCLGFFLGDICISEFGGNWVVVTDSYGTAPAIQRSKQGYITYILDSVSKRLRDNSVAKREIPSVVKVYQELC